MAVLSISYSSFSRTKCWDLENHSPGRIQRECRTHGNHEGTDSEKQENRIHCHRRNGSLSQIWDHTVQREQLCSCPGGWQKQLCPSLGGWDLTWTRRILYSWRQQQEGKTPLPECFTLRINNEWTKKGPSTQERGGLAAGKRAHHFILKGSGFEMQQQSSPRLASLPVFLNGKRVIQS